MTSVQGLCATFLLAALCLVAPLVAQTDPKHAPSDDSSDIVVNGVRDIVVNGRAIRCRPLADDPLDRIDTTPPYGRRGMVAVVPDGSGGFAVEPNSEQVTGPDFWQRVGIGIEHYVFRAPSNGKPMCIGGDADTHSFAGYRRIVDAAPYRGHRVRFMLWVATNRADLVHFWLAAGTNETKPPLGARKQANRLYNGGNTNNVHWGGDHGWIPVLLETGPIAKDAAHISYGFNLQGSGDVWVYKPTLEVVPDGSEGTGAGDRIVIGRDRR